MASRLTTNQEIAGSTPAVVILFCFWPASLPSTGDRATSVMYALVFDPQRPRSKYLRIVSMCLHVFRVN